VHAAALRLSHFDPEYVEILTDHPKRFRAMLIESENPAHSVADSARMRKGTFGTQAL